MKKIAFLLVMVSLVILSAACTKTVSSSAIFVGSVSSSIASIDKEFQQQVISYTILVENKSGNEIFISKVTPEFSSIANNQISDPKNSTIINKPISPYTSVNVTGELVFNSSSLTKEEISSALTITSVKIEYQSTLNIPLK